VVSIADFDPSYGAVFSSRFLDSLVSKIQNQASLSRHLVHRFATDFRTGFLCL
jgi:hypothetical protein